MIHLSEKHGLNPSMSQCFYCGEVKEIVIPGRLKGDVEAPHKAVWDMEPCPACKELQAQGVMLIEADESKGGTDNPFRTGCMAVVTDDAVKRIFTPEYAEQALKRRCAFVSVDAWTALGLPRENKDNRT